MFLGGAAIKLIENKKGFIYSLSELEKIIDIPLISLLSLEDSENLKKSLDFFISGLISRKLKKNRNFKSWIYQSRFFKKVDDYLNNNYSGKFLISNNLADFKSFNNIFLSIEIGSTLKKSYYELKKNIKFQNKSLIGCLAISIQSKKEKS